MSDLEMKRTFVMDLYPGPGWKKKVKNMSDAQIVAIYLREHVKPPKQNNKPKESGNDDIPF